MYGFFDPQTDFIHIKKDDDSMKSEAYLTSIPMAVDGEGESDSRAFAPFLALRRARSAWLLDRTGVLKGFFRNASVRLV